MKTFLANLRHAIRNSGSTTIGGGEFSSAELSAVLEQIEELRRLAEVNAELLGALRLVASSSFLPSVGTTREVVEAAITKATQQ